MSGPNDVKWGGHQPHPRGLDLPKPDRPTGGLWSDHKPHSLNPLVLSFPPSPPYPRPPPPAAPTNSYVLLGPASAIADESQSQEWDSRGLLANTVIQLKKLSGFEKHEISEILFFDRRRWTTVGAEDSFLEMVSVRPGGLYTKSQIQKELEILATCSMFEKVDREGKANPDGTLPLTISFTESTWQSAEKLRCINVVLMQQTKPIEMRQTRRSWSILGAKRRTIRGG